MTDGITEAHRPRPLRRWLVAVSRPLRGTVAHAVDARSASDAMAQVQQNLIAAGLDVDCITITEDTAT